jgi:hypothetical protein
MAETNEITELLVEIRDNQREALARQAEHLEVAKRQLEHAQARIQESMGLQREALTRQRTAMRVAVPGILVCIGAIVYLIVRYL